MAVAVLMVAAGGGLLAFTGFVLVFVARMSRRVKANETRPPRLPMIVYHPGLSKDGPAGGMIDISGRIVSTTTMPAPGSGRPCAVWELALFAAVPPSYAVDFDYEGQELLWITGHSTDVVVEYEQRWDVTPDPTRKGHPERRVTPGAGRVAVRADQLCLQLPGSAERVPGLSFFGATGGRLPADPAALARIGAPAELVARARANPAGHWVVEGSIAPGEPIRLCQTPLVAGGPVPDEPFFLYPLSIEENAAMGVGCGGRVLRLVAVLAGLFGVILVYAGLSRIA